MMKKVCKFCILATLTGFAFVFNSQGAAPVGWLDRAFGNNEQGGAGSFTISGGQTNITVEAGGTDIWGTDDTGRFVFTPLAGDCEIIATIPWIATNTTAYGEWLRTGVMMRGSTMRGAQNIAALRAKGTTLGNITKLSRRLTIRGTTANWTGSADKIFDYPNSTVRMRLRRQGDIFTAWSSTNAPAYDQWALVGTETYAYPKAMNLGVVVSRWQDLGPDTYTHSFSNVIARKLVNAKSYAGGIAVNWISDTPVASGSIVGYTVNRAPVNSSTFAELTELSAPATAYNDTTAGPGTTYVYRVIAKVEVGAVTNNLLVGDSLQLRVSDTANPSPAPVAGIAAQYYDTTALVNPVGARIEPSINDSWLLSTALVYPNGTPSGLTSLDTFRGVWNGSVVFPESGCYEIAVICDDVANIYINGERLVYQDAYMNGFDIFTAPFYLEAGRSYTFRADMQENSGGEAMRIKWFKADGSAISPVTMTQSVFEPFPLPWEHKDLGDSAFLGNASFNESDLSFKIAAGIGDIDNQHLIWQKSSSTDFDLLASAELTNADEAGVNAGLTVRSAASMGAQAVSVALVSADGAGARNIALTIRNTAGGAVSESTVAIDESIADLRLSRRGGSLLACYRTASSDGWVIATNLVITLPVEVCVGLQSYTATEELLATNAFSSVTFTEKLTANLTVNVASMEAAIATTGNPALVEQQRALQPAIGWYWYSAISDVVGGNYTVLKSTHWDNGYTELANLNAGNSYSYTDTLAAINTVYFYKMSYVYDLGDFADSSSNDVTMASDRIGVSDGSVNPGGAGLYNAFYRGLSASMPTNTPIHVQIRGLNAWDKGTVNTPIITAANSDDGLQIGPDNFACSWSGYVTPPYSGWYRFRVRTDDGVALFVGGKKLIEVLGVTDRQSVDIYLEAGVTLPFYCFFQQGTGGGYFNAWWKTGVGTNAEFVGIPVTSLTPLAPENTPFKVAPGSANEFGDWRNADIFSIATSSPGHAILSGTPDSFDVKVVGGGNDVWNTSDNFHYLYQETDRNFELKGTINALVQANGWTKVGFMVRESSAPNSRHTSIIQSSTQGRHTQYRATTGGTSNSHDSSNLAMLNDGGTISFTPTTFRIVRKKRKISFFLNDVPVPLASASSFEYDISSWSSDSIMVGLYVTAHDTAELSEGLYNDVTFTILHDKGTLILLQ